MDDPLVFLIGIGGSFRWFHCRHLCAADEVGDNRIISMAIEALSEKEQEIVLRCIKAAAAFIDDGEKHTRLGLAPKDLQRIIVDWPDIDDRDESANGFLAINNSMNEVCHGFRIATADWSVWFDSSPTEVDNTYRKWLALKGAFGAIR